MLAPPSAEAEDPPEELEDELDDPADALADEPPDELDAALDDESLAEDEVEDDSVERMLEASSKLGGPLKENWTPVGSVPVCPFLSITPNAVSCRNQGKVVRKQIHILPMMLLVACCYGLSCMLKLRATLCIQSMPNHAVPS